MKNRVIVDVSDNTLVYEFVSELNEFGFEILCSDEIVSDILEEASVNKFDFVNYSVFDADILKAIVTDRSDADAFLDMINNGIDPIDIVVVNFPDGIYDNISQNDAFKASLIYSSVSNNKDVCVIVDFKDYETVLNEIKNFGEVSKETRLRLSNKAFSYLLKFNSMFLSVKGQNEILPETLLLSYTKDNNLEFGENQHQSAAYYYDSNKPLSGLSDLKKLQGDNMSYTAIISANIALETIEMFTKNTVIVAKNGMIIGAGSSDNVFDAFSKATKNIVQHINESVLLINSFVDRKCALELAKYHPEAVLAKGYDADTEDILSGKSDLNLFIYESAISKQYINTEINGGMLVQRVNYQMSDFFEFNKLTDFDISEQSKNDLIFAQKILKNIRTCATVIVKDEALLGIGNSQVDYFSSFDNALRDYDTETEKSVVCIDGYESKTAYYEQILKANIRCLLVSAQTVDDEIVSFCNENSILLLTSNIQSRKL